MDLQPSAPPVVVVVVTTDPGDWFEECLASIAAQDYPNLSVLVVDTASATDPTSRVAAVLPRAFVHRLPERVPFGRAANDVLDVVDGASHFLFCHDDVALAPDATRLLVEEAYRSNAGITTPKVVEWDDRHRLLAVGAGADRLGVVHPLVEPGELDQEQHDAVRDVFVAPSCATLVRADLFSALRGFNGGIEQFGEDLDLCWRAHLAGARVVAVPAARARHRLAQVHGLRAGWRDAGAARRAQGLTEQHRLRTVVTCYSLLHLIMAVPIGALQALAEAIIYLARGRATDAAAALAAPVRALSEPGDLMAARRRIQRHRRVADPEIRRLQSRGNTRLRTLIRSVVAGDAGPVLGDDEASAMAGSTTNGISPRRASGAGGAWGGGILGGGILGGGGLGGGGLGGGGLGGGGLGGGGLGGGGSPRGASFRQGDVTAAVPDRPPWRWPTGLLIAVAVVLLVGSRSLLGHEIPAIGHLPATTGGPGRWWQLWWAPWRVDGLGSPSASPPALGLLALAGTLLFGAAGTLQHILILGPLLVGPWGAWRAARRFGSGRGSVAAVVVYAVLPLPYDALSQGRWPGLLFYAAAPWILASLAGAGGAAPLGGWRIRGVVGVLRLGLLVAFVGAFVPAALILVPLMGLSLAAAMALTGEARSGARSLTTAIGGAAVAVVLLLPWSAGTLGSATAIFGVGNGPAARLGLGAVMRFNTGPVGAGRLDWAFLAAAALPLVIGRAWRMAWAARWWGVALAFWALTWAGLRGWLPFPVGDPDVTLAPAAAGMALAAALGAAAFERDLPGYRFGWRQLASAVAAVAVLVGAVPVLGAASSGRWDLPSADASSALLLPGHTHGDYRVLWVGAPSALPLGSWQLSNGFAYATSVDGEPDLTYLWPPNHAGATPLIATDLRLAATRNTTDLGHLLAPLAVRYVVIPNHNAPSESGAEPVPVPGNLLTGLAMQTDLRLIQPDPNYTVYVNTAWVAAKALLPTATAAIGAATGTGPAASPERLRALLTGPLGSARPVLTGGRADGAQKGRLPHGGSLYMASTTSGRWHLDGAGTTTQAEAALGWAMVFPARPGDASLAVTAPAGTRIPQLIEVLLWLAVSAVVIVDGRRRRRKRAAPVASTEPAPSAADRRPLSTGSAGLQPEEVWADV